MYPVTLPTKFTQILAFMDTNKENLIMINFIVVVNITFQLIAVIGPVGSGKSSLLSSILEQVFFTAIFITFSWRSQYCLYRSTSHFNEAARSALLIVPRKLTQ